MNQNDFIYTQTHKGCLAAGVDEFTAKNTAVMTLQKYKNNQFTKPSALVKTAIAEAKKNRIKKAK